MREISLSTEQKVLRVVEDNAPRQRIAKVVRRRDTSVANNYGYGRWILRVMLCWEDQQGYLNEKDTECLWESDFFTGVSDKHWSKYQKQLKEANEVADAANRRLSVGLRHDTPEEILQDFLNEHGAVV